MDIASSLSRLRSLSTDAARIQQKIAEITRDEARAAAKVADCTSRAARATSISQAQSYARDAERAQQDVARLVQKRAEQAREYARKQEDIARLQSQVASEQEKQARTQSRLLLDLQATTRGLLERELRQAKAEMGGAPVGEYHAFISHASEDKDEIARPLAEALIAGGFKIWFDEMELKVGDSLRRSIDRGLAHSRFGVVVFSPAFFAKNWPQYELDGLVAREMTGGKVILPLWHRVTKDEVMKYSPSLADKLALNTAMFTVAQMADEIGKVLRG